VARQVKQILAQYNELKDIIAMLGLEQLSKKDRDVVSRARRLERFFTQPFFTTEQFTSMKGKFVSLEQALTGCERILRGEFDDYPESALYMIGEIGEAIKPKHSTTEKSSPKGSGKESSSPELENPEPDKSKAGSTEPNDSKPDTFRQDAQNESPEEPQNGR
jgi:F-type H+-transporting ATPase subunit beta